MSNRKQTPDVLGELLGGPLPGEEPTTGMPTPKKRPSKPAARKAAPAAPAPLPSAAVLPAQAAPQWEYLAVVFRDYRGWRPRLVNGREAGNWKESPLIHEYLKQMGEEGWELVNIGDRYHNEKEAYFKRRRP